jgi:hypothetical protein
VRRRLAVLGGALLALAGSAALQPAAAAALTARPICAPGPCGVWKTGSVRVSWAVSSDANYSEGCGVDTVRVEGTTRRVCSISADGSHYRAFVAIVTIDQTPPVVTGAAPTRPPEPTGWYRAPVGVVFAGTDAISGIESCTVATYAGPDTPAARTAGVCRDRAGNVSAPGAHTLRYDATAPALAAPTVMPGDRVVRIGWHAPADAVSVEVVRTPGRGGAVATVVHRGPGEGLVDRRVRNGRRYAYSVRAADVAGNVAVATVRARPGRRLLAPARGAVLSAPPLLAWTPIRGARYYNVQLFHRGRKVLSAWPRQAHLKLRPRWRYGGRRHRLAAGRYQWYVWPGRGRPAARRYGRRVGRGGFEIAADRRRP